MTRIFGAPSRYIQGPGASERLAPALAAWGPRAAAVADPIAADLLGERLRDSARAAGVDLSLNPFSGECTADEIDRQVELARLDGASAIVGLGGGKAIDTAKGAAQALGLPLIVLPTIASNDAPTSALIVIYDDAHRVAEARRTPRNPDLVLVDTEIIANAPARFLRAGIADGLSKTFEARQCMQAGGRNFLDGAPPEAALALADRAWNILRADGEAALADVEARRVTDALERVVEAAVLLSGLGFENGGLSLTHALMRGLTAEPELASRLHGELVAYALLVQLTLEGRDPAFLADLRAFHARLGLPRSLADLGGPEPSEALGLRVGALTLEAPYARHFDRPLSPADIATAMAQVESAAAAAA
ncbi:MAG: glycerol dehydrogenase [Pseudomonadota bacterium]